MFITYQDFIIVIVIIIIKYIALDTQEHLGWETWDGACMMIYIMIHTKIYI